MSSIGLNTNTFSITGRFLQLLTNFVVKAKVKQEVDEGLKENLVDFINKLKDENSTLPAFQLLSNIVERELRLAGIDFEQYLDEIIKEIRANDTAAFLPKIEFISDVIEMENSEALSKIMGE
ncbi:hypothetical protein [Pedobacter sp. KLB.chiD]|uniref:hypothetical protein n=1 Tax=Pedobacter sp. KLB.chiD TaxID=3387402 RepID=UPI00399B993C